MLKGEQLCLHIIIGGGLDHRGQGICLTSIAFAPLRTSETEKENLEKEWTGVSGHFAGDSFRPLTLSNNPPASRKC